MKIETFHDLIDWTRQLHGHLAECLKHCATQQEETRAKWLLEYLGEHEAMRLAQQINRARDM